MSPRARSGVKYALAALGVILLLIGVSLGEYATVFKKAASICFECIGIG
ncbi:MAG: hypothetical protein H6Q60_1185 [Oscillospiraceae bacterium]|nr:hypothetical protein [Oscillospiraceae bacterium]